MENETSPAYHGSEKIENEAKRLEQFAVIANKETIRVLSGLKEKGLMPKHILDAGCGTGDVFSVFANLFPLATIEGIDRSEEAARVAHERHGVTVHDADLAQPDAFDAIAPADLIYFRSVLLHLSDPAAIVARAAEHLTPHGILMAQEPDWSAAEADWEDFRSFKESFIALMQGLGIKPFLGQELEALLTGAGLTGVTADRSTRRITADDPSWNILYSMLEVGGTRIIPELQKRGVKSVEEMRRRIETARAAGKSFVTPAWVIAWGGKANAV